MGPKGGRSVDESQTIRVSVEEAATLLGIEKDAGGTTWVYLDKSQTSTGQSTGQSETDRGELVGELRDRVRSLERRLDDEGESRRRADTIIAQLTQANTTFSKRLQ